MASAPSLAFETRSVFLVRRRDFCRSLGLTIFCAVGRTIFRCCIFGHRNFRFGRFVFDAVLCVMAVFVFLSTSAVARIVSSSFHG